MFKNVSVLEVKASEDRMHRYECPPESPLGEVHDVLHSMLSHVIGKIKDNEKQEEKPCEEACKPSNDCDISKDESESMKEAE